MVTGVELAQVFLADPRVDLGRRDVGVAEQHLEGPQIGAALEQVGDVAARSTAKSTVSARFVAATRARLDEISGQVDGGRGMATWGEPSTSGPRKQRQWSTDASP